MNAIFKLLAGAALVTTPFTAHAAECVFVRGEAIADITINHYTDTGTSDAQALANRVAQDMLKPENSKFVRDIPSGCRTPALLAQAFISPSVNTAQDKWPNGNAKFYMPTMMASSAPKPIETVAIPASLPAETAGVRQAPPESTPSVAKVPPARTIEKVVTATKVVQEGLSDADEQRLKDLKTEDTRLQGEIDTINQLPSPTAEELAQLAALTDQKKGIQAQMTALSGRVNNLQNEVSGMWNWLYGIIAAMVIGFGLLAWCKPSKKSVKTKVETALADYVTTATFEARLGAVEARFKHVVEKTTLTQLPAQMKAMKDGNKFTYPLKVDGEVVKFDAIKVSTTPSGDALIKVDGLDALVTAKQLFGALADHIENGGTVPTVKAVNA